MSQAPPGGSQIITAVLQVMLNVIDFPHVRHQSKPDRLGIERGLSSGPIALLKKAGYPVEEAIP